MTKKTATAALAAVAALVLTSCTGGTSKPADPGEFARTGLELTANAAESPEDCETAQSWMTGPISCEELGTFAGVPAGVDFDQMQCGLAGESGEGVRVVECALPSVTINVHVTGDGDSLTVFTVSSS